MLIEHFSFQRRRNPYVMNPLSQRFVVLSRIRLYDTMMRIFEL